MSTLSSKDLKKAILQQLSTQSSANKFNLIGRGESRNRGGIEYQLGVDLSADERALAARSFEELQRDGYIQATYTDLTRSRELGDHNRSREGISQSRFEGCD